MPNFVVSSLPDYVQENRDLILKNFGLVGNATRSRIGIQTGIKKSAYLNYLELAPTLQDGAACGYESAGSATLTQREINVATIKVNLDICAKTLLGKWGEYLVRIRATEQELPFEQYIIDGITRELNKKIEKLIWQGDKTSLDSNLKWINGFLAQFTADNDVVDVPIAAGTSAYAGLVSVYAAMTDETLERGGVIFVAPAIYKAFLQELVNLNFYHYSGPQNAAPNEFALPGTDVLVIKTPGLSGTLAAVGTFAENLVYGTDFENDEEDFLIDYEAKSKVYHIVTEWNSGVAYHFPAEVVFGVFASSPAVPGSSAHTLAAIAADIDGLAGDISAIKTDIYNIAGSAASVADADHVFKTKEQA